jgi:rare lipoprotein A
MKRHQNILVAALLAVAPLVAIPGAQAATDAEAILQQRATHLDRSGKRRIGIASYYHAMFNWRKMADGNLFDPDGINAASKSLPLGTLVRVTNLETNQSAVVRIQDRGPYVDGRIIDLSPRVAQELGMANKGLARVAVTPVVVPMPDGSLRVGAGAFAERSPSTTNPNVS